MDVRIRLLAAASLLLVWVALPTLAQDNPLDATLACQELIPAGDSFSFELDHPEIFFDNPLDQQVIRGDQVVVTVNVENIMLDGANHWHLWVDGQLRGMVYQPTVIIALEPGTHQLCAALSDTLHGPVGRAVGVTVQVEALPPGAPTATPFVSSDVGTLIQEPALGPVQIILLVGGGLLAALAGWWVGARLSKK